MILFSDVVVDVAWFQWFYYQVMMGWFLVLLANEKQKMFDF